MSVRVLLRLWLGALALSYQTVALSQSAAPSEVQAEVQAEAELATKAEDRAVLPLMPEDVLASSAERFPDILASLEREAIARGAQLEALGAFDLVLSADGFSRVTGFWSGSVVEAEARQRLRNTPVEVYGAYRLSDGRFPIYEDEYFTNSLGEFKIGGLYSLLRDSAIDSERFGVEDARLATRQASLEVLLTQLIVQHRALNAYWRWVARGREIAIYRDLLAIAEARQLGLDRQFAAGAVAEIALVENERNILQRQRLLAEAERNYMIAANDLSFYLRDGTGSPRVPGRKELPAAKLLAETKPPVGPTEARLSDTLEARPELQQLRVAMERARNKIDLRENDLKPQLDLSFELSRDIGSIAEGGSSRDSTDAIVGFTFTVPLQRRAAEGRLQQAEAELREIELREQRLSDELTIELENILIDLQTAQGIAQLADREVAQAGRMVSAERRRFQLGAGDFFLVNLREQDAADAEVRAVRARLANRLAAVRLDAAAMNLEGLGLSEPPL